MTKPRVIGRPFKKGQTPHAGRLWKKGLSGNPAGKKPGTRSAAIMALEAIGTEAANKILRAMIRKADKGDVQAAALIFGRVWPVRKGEPLVLDIPAPKDAAGIVQALAAITDKVLNGELTAEEAAALTAVVEAQRKAIDTMQLEARIAALEARAAVGKV